MLPPLRHWVFLNTVLLVVILPCRFYDTAGNLHSSTRIYKNTGVDSLDELVQNQTPEMDFFECELGLQILCSCPKVMKRRSSSENGD